MSDEPFREMAQQIGWKMRYADMEIGCDRARSSAWWNNLIRYGAWNGYSGRVAPPPPEALDGIVKLFETVRPGITKEEVAAMIAADWYQVQCSEVSPRVRQMESAIDQLSQPDADLIESVARRLAFSGGSA